MVWNLATVLYLHRFVKYYSFRNMKKLDVRCLKRYMWTIFTIDCRRGPICVQSWPYVLVCMHVCACAHLHLTMPVSFKQWVLSILKRMWFQKVTVAVKVLKCAMISLCDETWQLYNVIRMNPMQSKSTPPPPPPFPPNQNFAFRLFEPFVLLIV